MKRPTRLTVALLLIMASFIFLFSGCPSPSSEPSYSIKSFTSDKVHVALNDTVTLKWEYSEDLTNKLISQRLEFMSTSFDPGGMRTEVVDLNNSLRTYQRVFKGTVVVMLVAKSPQSELKACLELTPDPSTNPWYMKAQISNVSTLLQGGAFVSSRYYPDLGYPPIPSPAQISELNFTTYFACYDGTVNYNNNNRPRKNYNNYIDSLKNIMDPNNPFFLAFTTDFQEMKDSHDSYYLDFAHIGYFKKTLGSGYPYVSVDISQDQTQSNVVIYGGAIVHDGTSTQKYTASDGTPGTTTYDVTHCAPIFMAITLFFPDHFCCGTNIPVNLADVEIGNIKQGLVAAMNHYSIPYTGMSQGSTLTFTWEVNGQESDYLYGELKGDLTVGVQVTTFDGQLGISLTKMNTLKFNLPFYPDSKIDSFVSGAGEATAQAKLSKPDEKNAVKATVKMKPIQKKIEK